MRDGSTTRQRIQQEAIRLFVTHGVDAVSMRDIAGAAGLRPSALYAHWPSRDALVAELFLTGYADYGRRLAACLDPDATTLANIAAVVTRVCRFHAEDERLFRFLLLNQHMHLKDVGAMPDNPVGLLQGLVAKAQAAGEIGPGDPALLTAAIVGILAQPEVFRIHGRITRGYADIAGDIRDLVLRMLPTPLKA
ncbi:MAG TPA: TetR/AcrR family transcriptional regulator [Stellaceae bacterium]|nr:TetR/AcrR family transcriptional regulator [Stellaceae bacterium]